MRKIGFKDNQKICRRLYELCKFVNVKSILKLLKNVNISSSAFYDWTKEVHRPSAHSISRICKYYEINFWWLYYGEGKIDDTPAREKNLGYRRFAIQDSKRICVYLREVCITFELKNIYHLFTQAGVSKSTFYYWKKGNHQPTKRILLKICNCYQINFSWLAYGTGEMRTAKKEKGSGKLWLFLFCLMKKSPLFAMQSPLTLRHPNRNKFY